MYLNGIKYMTKLPDVVIVIDQHQDSTAIQECKKLGIPVIGIVDTNGDPSLVDIPIPANDDSITSIRCILKFLLEEIQQQRYQSYTTQKKQVILTKSKNSDSKNLRKLELRSPSLPASLVDFK